MTITERIERKFQEAVAKSRGDYPKYLYLGIRENRELDQHTLKYSSIAAPAPEKGRRTYRTMAILDVNKESWLDVH